MKKHTLIMLAAFLVAGTTTHNYAVKDKTVAKAIKKGGTWVGRLSGFAAGYIGGREIAKRIGLQRKEKEPALLLLQPFQPYKPPKEELVRVGTAITAGTIGGEIGKYLGEKAAVLYLSKRNNVSKQVALASLISDRDLNNETKALFHAAEQKDTEFLKGFFTTYYSDIFGKQWHTIVSRIINKALASKIATAFRLRWQMGDQEKQFYKTTPLSYAISTLYFDKNFPTLEKGPGSNAQIKATEQLLDELFGKMEVDIPKE